KLTLCRYKNESKACALPLREWKQSLRFAATRMEAKLARCCYENGSKAYALPLQTRKQSLRYAVTEMSVG
ncbi:hypothetical protein MUO65_08495, partial [bacterium]|nr:hypothetical protein [bacterium]